MNDEQGRMTPDERYEQAAMAQMGERRNQPRHFIVIGALALLVSVVAVVVTWLGREDAASDLANRETKLTELAGLTSRWLELSSTAASDDEQDGRFVQSRVRELATRAGMSATPPLVTPSVDNIQNARRIRYRYDVRDASLAALMSWVDLMLVEYRGLGAWLREIEIKPSGSEWQLKVEFAHWEQSST